MNRLPTAKLRLRFIGLREGHDSRPPITVQHQLAVSPVIDVVPTRYSTVLRKIHLPSDISGFTGKPDPRKATVEAVWMVNRFDGLRILYMRTINLAKTKR